MKYKILYADYNKETKVSTVTIQNKYGIFTGTSKLWVEDEDYESRFTGCRIAELKALRKSFKYARKKAYDVYDALYLFYMDLQNKNKAAYECFSKKIDPQVQTMIYLDEMINRCTEQIKNLSTNEDYKKYITKINSILHKKEAKDKKN